MEMREEEFSDRLNTRATFIGCTALHYACIIDDAGNVFNRVNFNQHKGSNYMIYEMNRLRCCSS